MVAAKPTSSLSGAYARRARYSARCARFGAAAALALLLYGVLARLVRDVTYWRGGDDISLYLSILSIRFSWCMRRAWRGDGRGDVWRGMAF